MFFSFGRGGGKDGLGMWVGLGRSGGGKREQEWVWTWEKVGRGGGKCDAFCVFFHGDLVRVDGGGGLGQRGDGAG